MYEISKWVDITQENVERIVSQEMRDRVWNWLRIQPKQKILYRRMNESRREIIVFTSTGVAGICKDGEYVEWGRSSSPSADGERWYMAVKDDDGTSFFDEDGDPMCEHFGCFKKAKWRNCDGRPTCGEFSPL